MEVNFELGKLINLGEF